MLLLLELINKRTAPLPQMLLYCMLLPGGNRKERNEGTGYNDTIWASTYNQILPACSSSTIQANNLERSIWLGYLISPLSRLPSSASSFLSFPLRI
jgi:hypothetical protein